MGKKGGIEAGILLGENQARKRLRERGKRRLKRNGDPKRSGGIIIKKEKKY